MKPNQEESNEHITNLTPSERNLIFYMGVLGLLFVPIFKITTELPPFVGMLFTRSYGLATELLHRNKNYDQKIISLLLAF